MGEHIATYRITILLVPLSSCFNFELEVKSEWPFKDNVGGHVTTYRITILVVQLCRCFNFELEVTSEWSFMD